MKLTITCSYCGVALLLKIGDLQMKRRSLDVGPPVKCENCGSSTQIVLETKRVRKGAGMKLIEAKREERYLAELEKRRAANRVLGEQLVSEPGCNCVERAERSRITHEGHDGGHPLSTGWSRDPKFDAMFPTEPRHLHGCPCRPIKNHNDD